MKYSLKEDINTARFGKCFAYGAVIGIFLGMWLHVQQTPNFFTEEAHAETVVMEEVKPVEVILEVTYTREDIIRKIESAFPEDPKTAVAIAKSESGKNLNPKAYNPEWHHDKYGNRICQGSYGLMQVACVHNIDNPEALFDIDFNLKKAKQIYDYAKVHKDSPWRDWGGWSSGGYKKYL